MHDLSQPYPQGSVKKQPASPSFSLPLVSIIIVNYNYGRYLREAVDSVFGQSYPNIECIIVDNASTDESPEVLHGLSKQYPGTTILRRNDNGGQSLASKEGFDIARGEYVVFLDADDVLMPAFVETSVFVHLSLRIPVGFTSADMAQAVGSRLVLGTYYGLSGFVRSGRGRMKNLMRRVDDYAPELWPLRRFEDGIEKQVHLIQPRDVKDWYWAPTSGNCFRRDALQFFLNNENLAALKSCTDSYLIRGVSVLMGSAIIDRPLAIYRLHGMNAFSKHPHLYGMLTYEKGAPLDNDILGRKMLMDHMLAKSGIFSAKANSRVDFINALQALDLSYPILPSAIAGYHSYLTGQLVLGLSQRRPKKSWLGLLLTPKSERSSPASRLLQNVFAFILRLNRAQRELLLTFLKLNAEETNSSSQI